QRSSSVSISHPSLPPQTTNHSSPYPHPHPHPAPPISSTPSNNSGPIPSSLLTF
ncbi:hypothetical protein H0H93_005704, partial [Arthromyces matolae]